MEYKEIVAYLNGAINFGKVKTLEATETNQLKRMLQFVFYINDNKEDNKEKQFCLWLQGYIDCLETNTLNEQRFKKIMQKIKELENAPSEKDYILYPPVPGQPIAKC